MKWIEDRRENLLAAGQGPPRARRRHDGLRRRRRHPGRRTSTTRPGLRRLPDALAGRRPRPSSACCSPVPTGCRTASFADEGDVHQHRWADRLPGAVAVRVAGPRGAARHRRPADGHRPGRAAPPQPAAPGRAALRQPQRHDLRPHLAAARPSSRRSRCSTTTRSAPSRPRPARPAATSASALSTYVEPTTPGLRLLRAPRAATIRIEPSGQGQRLHRRRLDRQQPRDHGRAAHRRRARRGHRRRQHDPGRHRRHRRSAPARPAAAAVR